MPRQTGYERPLTNANDLDGTEILKMHHSLVAIVPERPIARADRVRYAEYQTNGRGWAE
jgi:hypothetical protein